MQGLIEQKIKLLDDLFKGKFYDRVLVSQHRTLKRVSSDDVCKKLLGWIDYDDNYFLLETFLDGSSPSDTSIDFLNRDEISNYLSICFDEEVRSYFKLDCLPRGCGGLFCKKDIPLSLLKQISFDIENVEHATLDSETLSQNAPHYLMMDHGGVLDGIFMRRNQITPEDLILKKHDEGYFQVLKNGVNIVNHLNQLINLHHYKLVFHSKNVEQDQMDLLTDLKEACAKKGITFPPVHAMAVKDSGRYKNSSHEPYVFENEAGIWVCAWGEDDLDGKTSVRQALEAALNISPTERSNHTVFDDGPTCIEAAELAGYQVYLIEGPGGVKLYEAIEDTLLKLTDLPLVENESEIFSLSDLLVQPYGNLSLELQTALMEKYGYTDHEDTKTNWDSNDAFTRVQLLYRLETPIHLLSDEAYHQFNYQQGINETVWVQSDENERKVLLKSFVCKHIIIQLLVKLQNEYEQEINSKKENVFFNRVSSFQASYHALTHLISVIQGNSEDLNLLAELKTFRAGSLGRYIREHLLEKYSMYIKQAFDESQNVTTVTDFIRLVQAKAEAYTDCHDYAI